MHAVLDALAGCPSSQQPQEESVTPMPEERLSEEGHGTPADPAAPEKLKEPSPAHPSAPNMDGFFQQAIALLPKIAGSLTADQKCHALADALGRAYADGWNTCLAEHAAPAQPPSRESAPEREASKEQPPCLKCSAPLGSNPKCSWCRANPPARPEEAPPPEKQLHSTTAGSPAIVDTTGKVQSGTPSDGARAALREVRGFVAECAREESIYGYGSGVQNPYDFCPDAESCTPEEIEAHRIACEAWDTGQPVTTGDRGCSPLIDPETKKAVGWVTRAAWGIGVYTIRDERAVAALAVIDAALAPVSERPPEQPAPPQEKLK